jgi:hypothetical protein
MGRTHKILTPSRHQVAVALNTLIEGSYWPDSISTNTTYVRRQDDTDGERSSEHDLVVHIGCDGDAWVRAGGSLRTLRFRNCFGGGWSVRVRNALLVLAEAIRRDNEARPQPLNEIEGSSGQ